MLWKFGFRRLSCLSWLTQRKKGSGYDNELSTKAKNKLTVLHCAVTGCLDSLNLVYVPVEETVSSLFYKRLDIEQINARCAAVDIEAMLIVLMWDFTDSGRKLKKPAFYLVKLCNLVKIV